ncbi:DMT family transporter [bacterium]|nr:DMT family transporter [bacterium]
MTKSNNILGHLLAFFSSLIWGTTLVSTKILLKNFQPVEILFFRFLMALLMFYIICPKKAPHTTKKQKIIIILAGITGVTLYYLLENIALNYTLAANVSIINCCAPFLTAIFTFLFLKNKEKINRTFFIGFVVSIIGIWFILFNGNKINLNSIGDILAMCAAISWAIYSILIKKIADYNIPTLLVTRKTFLYGIIFMIPFLFLFDFKFDLTLFFNLTNLLNLLFLGFIASGICFLMWNKSIKIIGTVKSGVYLYLIPVVTVILSSIILKEPISIYLIMGVILTILGLIISEIKTD